MLACVLLALLVDDGPTAPPGTELPNKDELVKTVREQFTKRMQPLDNYIRRQGYPGRAEGLQESFVQINGDYRKSLSKDHLGVERLYVMTPTLFFALVKLPDGPAWKFNYRLETDEAQRERFRKTWLVEAGITDHGGVDWDVSALAADPPQAKITKVTAERVNQRPVYRFHFTREIVGEGASNSRARHQEGTLDVDPAQSWALVRASVGSRERPGFLQEAEFTYQGLVHGRPALRRSVVRSTQKNSDGQTETLSERTTDVTQYAEQTTFDPTEYAMEFYSQDLPKHGVPYRAYVLVATTVVLLLLVGYALFFKPSRRTPGGTAEASIPV